MNTLALSGTIRTELGKTPTKQVRKAGLVPCVLYGKDKTYHFSLSVKDLSKAIYTPETYLIELSIDGKSFKAIMQHASFHPVHDNVLDAEFCEVHETDNIQVSLPIKLYGTSEGVLAGGKLVQKQRRLKVQGVYTKLPAYLEINISDLRLGRSLKVGDLNFENVKIVMQKDVPIASVEITRALRQEAAAATKGKK